MKYLTLLLLLCFLSGCSSSDEVDDSDVIAEAESGNGDTSDDESKDDDADVVPAAAPKQTDNGPFQTSGEHATLLYNIASGALKKADSTLNYTVKCTYTIKPLTIKSCMVKTGFLPKDAKMKIGKLLLEAKNLPRKKIASNEAVVISNYSCTKGKTESATTCVLTKREDNIK